MGFLQFTQVTEGPSDLIAVPLNKTATVVGCPKNFGYVTRHRGFLRNTNNHVLSLCFRFNLATKVVKKFRV